MLITGGSGLHFRALVDPMSFAPTDVKVRAELEGTPIEEVVAELRRIDPEADRNVDMANSRRVIRAVEIWRLSGERPSRRASSAEAEDLRRYVPEIEFTAVGVDPGDGLEQRVEARLEEMRAGGLVEEVSGLRQRLGRTARNAVGYREVLDALDGLCSIDESFERAARNTRKLARRQRTWFQRDPRIRWIPWFDDEANRIDRVLEAMS
jgi:tRNA dimethylallyltransferase